MFKIDSVTAAKKAATRLRKRLGDTPISASASLEAVAAMMGHKNWNVAAAALQGTDVVKSPVLGVQDMTALAWFDVYFEASPATQPSQTPSMPEEPAILEGVAGRSHLNVALRKGDQNQGLWYPVTDLADAELLMMRLAYARRETRVDLDLTTITPSPQVSVADKALLLALHINRQATYIAMCTRSAAGNTVLLSRRLYEWFRADMSRSEVKIAELGDPTATDTNFLHCGTINGFLDVYCSDAMDDDVVYVVFKDKSNESEAGAFFVRGERNYLHVPNRGMSGLRNDYVRAIRVKW